MGLSMLMSQGRTMRRTTDPEVRKLVQLQEERFLRDVERLLRFSEFDKRHGEAALAAALRKWKEHYRHRGEEVARQALGLCSRMWR